MVFNEIILKVTNRCNLNCSYCYVFNQGDSSYKDEVSRLSDTTAFELLSKLELYVKKHNLKTFTIIFHGGEPLLVGIEFYEKFIMLTSEIVISAQIEFAIQTNATLLTQEWCAFFKKQNIQVGLSIDGPEKASIYRVYKTSGKPAYNEIIRGLNLLKEAQIDISTLSVINVDIEPDKMYAFLKQNDIFFLDLLLPDATYEKMNNAVGRVGSWLSDIFSLWYDDEDQNKPIIRIFNLIISLMLGYEENGNEVFGVKNNTAINIKSNGDISSVDTLKICGDQFTKSIFNVAQNTLDDINENCLAREYYFAHTDGVLCLKCQKCIIKHICGGGQLAHRFSNKKRFNNPTVYCKDILSLVIYIQNILYKNIPEMKALGVELLFLSDFDYLEKYES